MNWNTYSFYIVFNLYIVHVEALYEIFMRFLFKSIIIKITYFNAYAIIKHTLQEFSSFFLTKT